MYGLPQEGNIYNDKTKQHLAKFGYDPAPITPEFLWHKTRHLKFSLVVDNFGVQYERQSDITHQLDAFKKIYKIYEDW